MPKIHRTVLIEFSPKQMFELVDRCEDYSQFLPWCGGAEVHQRDELITEATIFINYHGIRTHFTTRNTKRIPEHILIQLKEGPFKHLEATWQFTALDEHSCKILFDIQYDFSNKILEKMLGKVFNFIASSFVDAFVKRAREVY